MKNTKTGFYSFKQYLSLDFYIDIYRCTSEVMEIQLKYFVFFPCTWKIKFYNTSKTKVFLAVSSNVSYVRHTCYVPSHRKRRLRWLWWHNEIIKDSQKHGQHTCKNFGQNFGSKRIFKRYLKFHVFTTIAA